MRETLTGLFPSRTHSGHWSLVTLTVTALLSDCTGDLRLKRGP